MRVLVVTNPFAGYAQGQVIDSPGLIDGILAGAHSGHVVLAEAAEPPAEQPRKRKE